MIRFARARRLEFGLLLLLSSAARTQAQQNPKLTPVNYGNIVLTASTWPFLIAEQEGLFQKEGIDFKRSSAVTRPPPRMPCLPGPRISRR
jgi:ABC-type nitrate/sulfonate/bicarbonate transport system substrate-binding protein